jgi:hypothetical protein
MRTFPRHARAAAPLHHQSHHIIPVGVFAGPAFAAQFDALSGHGFDARQFQRNGVFLPATEVAAIRSGLPLHRGPHRRYNELVAYRVAAIFRDFDRASSQPRARFDAAQRMDLLTSALRAVLRRTSPRMSLNQRDPFNSRASFHDLDSACDAIWLATK